jgi:hypothetical protein
VIPARVLWTGGWDSSFRLLQALLIERRPVQPIYLVNPDRDSTLHEIRAMEAIRSGVTARLDDPDMLAPTEVHVRTHFSISRELVTAHDLIAGRIHIGSQYLWLAAAAEALDWYGVELSLERWEEGLSPLQRVVFDERGELNGSPESQLFRYWSFPVLHLTKNEMAGIAREHGFLDLLSSRWFCHIPFRGKPCGLCRPCRLAHREGVRFANPSLARARLVWRAVRRGEGPSRLARRALGHL